jgi:hypothetical protein
MIKRADASKISREKATKEQIAENFKRLAVDTDKKVQLKPSILKTVKSLDGKTFGIIHENKTYYLKYTTKNGSTNPADFKHLDGLNSTFGIEKHNSFEKATNKMSFICEAQNNAYKLRLLNEAEEDTEEKEEDSIEKITTDDTEEKLLADLDKEKEEPAAEPEMGGELPAADMGAAPEEPIDTTKTGTETPKEIAGDILGGIGDEAAPEGETAPDMGAAPEEPIDTTKTGTETPKEIAGDILGGIGDEAAPEGETAPDMCAAPEGDESDPKKEFQETVGKIGQLINELQDKEEFNEGDVKNAMNSIISAIGAEGFKMVGDEVVDSFIKKMRGSQEEIDTTNKPEEAPAQEEPSTEKLDENFLRQLKSESKRLLKEQLKQEIEKRKKSILIESIKRKLK